jgi:hypothetical protein
MSSTAEHADLWDEKWDRQRPSGTMAAPRPKHSLVGRAFRTSFRFLITLGIGVAGTLAWQAYGDEAREMAATAYPEQLGWIAPQAGTTDVGMSNGSAAMGAPAGSATDQQMNNQQMNTLAYNLAAVRQTLDQLAAQVATGQQQMSGDIARLQASEQDILIRLATPRPVAAPARKPVPPAAATSLSPTMSLAPAQVR